jgi:hypothetical protein
MPARHQVESHKFWDIVALWAKEQLEAEEVIARALAKGVLEHLLAVVRAAREPSREVLRDEFILKDDFRAWLRATKQALPAFWFGKDDA